MSDKAFEITQKRMKARAMKVRIIGGSLCALSAIFTIYGEFLSGMVALLGALLWIGTQERIGTEVKSLSYQVANASKDLQNDAIQTIEKSVQAGFSKLEMPDLSAIQIDTNALVEAMKPGIQEILAGSFKGLKGADEAGLRRAAKFIKEGLPDESDIPLLEAIDAGDPEAIQIAQAGKMFAKMLPALMEKSPLMADYGETFIQAIPTLFAMRRQRQQGAVQFSQGKATGVHKPGLIR